MTREQARERFGTLWGLGVLVSLLFHGIDPPDSLRLLVGIPLLAAIAWFGIAWLRMGIRDGAVRVALPDYGWAFLSLLVISAGCAAVALLVLAAAGQAITPDRVSNLAFYGLVLVLAGWWIIRGRRRA